MQEFGPDGITTLLVPRGKQGLEPLKLDMTEIYLAEKRLEEVKIVNSLTSPELRGTYNQACNLTSKYIAWIKYEILQANKSYRNEKARVILDDSVAAFAKYKEAGIKYNEDFREALIARDPACSDMQERMDMLEAAETLLKGKLETFVRAYFSCNEKQERDRGAPGIAASPHMNGNLGMTQEPGANLMGGVILAGIGKVGE